MDRDHAIVVGGSVAGLCAARALSRSFARVTVLEQDPLPEGAEVRRGAPQGHHIHALLAHGAELLEAFFPGIDAELAEAGAPLLQIGRDVGYLSGFGWAPRFEPAIPLRAASRPLIEARVRRRVRALEQVTVRGGVQVSGLLSSAAKDRVQGVALDGGERLEADLVVDASGRGSRAPGWLEQLGRRAPRATVVDALVGYSTRVYEEVPPLPDGWRCVFLLWTPEVTRGGVLFPLEGGRTYVTLAGVGGDYPPTDEAGFLAYSRTMRGPHVHDAISRARPLGPIHGTRSTANRWVHYERLPDQPAGFVALGDAACAFNPIYGQGMTVAVLGASLLGELAERPVAAEKFPRLFQRALAARLGNVWSMSTNEDFRIPTTQGRAPFAARLGHLYLDAVLKLGARDPDVTRTISRVLQLLDPPGKMLRPGLALRAVAHTLGG